MAKSIRSNQQLGQARLLLGICLLGMVPPKVFAEAVPVTVISTQERAIYEEIPISGSVTSPSVSRLSPEVAGYVAEVLVDIGQQVVRGDILLRLDPTMAEIAVEAARATSAQAREELADAQRRFNDAKRLRKSSGIAENEYQSRRSEVRADRAALQRLQAEQRREQERLNRHELRAPFDGVISRKLTEVGEWINPGDQIMELVANHGLRFDFQVPQSHFPRVTRRTQLVVRLEALPNQPIDASVAEIVPVSDPTARTFLVRVSPADDTLPLTPGMSVSATLRLGSGERRVVVNRDALLRHPDGRVTAWVVAPDGENTRVQERSVQTGLAFAGLVEVRSGLEAGERVVVEGNETLQQNQAVSIKEAR